MPGPLPRAGLEVDGFLQPEVARWFHPGPLAAQGWGRGAKPKWSPRGPRAPPGPGARRPLPARPGRRRLSAARGEVVVAGTEERQGDCEEVPREGKPSLRSSGQPAPT